MGSESSVYEGKTLDDAVRKGLEALGLSRAEAMITILEEGSGGFLGLGSRPYRVRIMPRPGGAFPEAGGRSEGRSLRRSEGRNGRRERGGRGSGERRASGERGARPSAERGGRAPGERGGRGEGRRGEGRRGEPRGGVAASEHGGRERAPDEGRRGDRGRGRESFRGGEGGRPQESREPDRRHEEPMRAEGGRHEEPMPVEGRPHEEPMRAEGPRDDGGERRGRRRRRGGRGRDREGAPFRAAETGPGGGPIERAPRPEREPMMEPEPMMDDLGADAIAAPAPRVAVHEEREMRGGREEREMRGGREEREFRRPPREHEGPALSPEQLVTESTRLTSEFLKAMGFDATVSATAEEDRVEVSAAVAQDEDLLNGKKGEVRQALQHLLNRMLNRGEGSRYHLQLEINDFWKRREEELAGLARELAEEALEKNDEAVTEYLNAQERRIVHVTLREDTRVKTYALGSGLIKRVAVAPADFPEGPRSE